MCIAYKTYEQTKPNCVNLIHIFPIWKWMPLKANLTIKNQMGCISYQYKWLQFRMHLTGQIFFTSPWFGSLAASICLCHQETLSIRARSDCIGWQENTTNGACCFSPNAFTYFCLCQNKVCRSKILTNILQLTYWDSIVTEDLPFMTGQRIVWFSSSYSPTKQSPPHPGSQPAHIPVLSMHSYRPLQSS